MNVDSGYAEVNGVRIYYERSGKGEPILLIHGFPRWMNDFNPITPELSNTNQVYSIDLRGHGKSSRADSYTFSDYKQDIIQFIERKIKHPTIFFGHSLGGWITLMIASSHPHLVKAAIIGDSPLNLRDFHPNLASLKDHWTQRREYSSQCYDQLKSEMDKDSALRLSQVDPSVFDLWIGIKDDYRAFEKLLNGYDIETLLQNISRNGCPVLLIQGKTRTMTDKDVEYAKSVLSNVSHVFLENQGHYLGLDTGDTTDLVTVLETFIGSL